MRTTEYNTATGQWAALDNGEYLRTAKRGVVRWFKSEAEAAKAK